MLREIRGKSEFRESDLRGAETGEHDLEMKQEISSKEHAADRGPGGKEGGLHHMRGKGSSQSRT